MAYIPQIFLHRIFRINTPAQSRTKKTLDNDQRKENDMKPQGK